MAAVCEWHHPAPCLSRAATGSSLAAGGHVLAHVTMQLATNNQPLQGLATDSKGITDRLVMATPETHKVTWHRTLSSQDQMPEMPLQVLSGRAQGSRTECSRAETPRGVAVSRSHKARGLVSKQKQMRWRRERGWGQRPQEQRPRKAALQG